jgi:hypothetical protein
MINQSKQYFHSLIHINTKIQNNARKIKKKHQILKYKIMLER